MTPSMKAHTQILFLKHREQSLTFKEINILVYFHLLKEKSGFSTRTLRYPLATLKTTAQFCCYVTLRNGKPGSSFLTTSQQMWHIQELKMEGGGGRIHVFIVSQNYLWGKYVFENYTNYIVVILIYKQHHKDWTKISFYVAFISKRYQRNIELVMRYSERRRDKNY